MLPQSKPDQYEEVKSAFEALGAHVTLCWTCEIPGAPLEECRSFQFFDATDADLRAAADGVFFI